MRLPIAVAALLLVLVAHAKAQEEPGPTLEERFTAFQRKLQELATELADKTKSAAEQFHEGEFATQTRTWFKDNFEKMKQKFDDLSV